MNQIIFAIGLAAVAVVFAGGVAFFIEKLAKKNTPTEKE